MASLRKFLGSFLWHIVQSSQEEALRFSQDSVKFDTSQYVVRSIGVMRRDRRRSRPESEVLTSNVFRRV
jgi:hypothetical protein